MYYQDISSLLLLIKHISMPYSALPYSRSLKIKRYKKLLSISSELGFY